MPFVSKAQQGYMEANKSKLKKQGVDVDEWAAATDYSSLPATANSDDSSRKNKFTYSPKKKNGYTKGERLA